jgi:hypothetical protein
MTDEQDDLALVYMYGFKNGQESMKAEIKRLRAALYRINGLNDHPARFSPDIDAVIEAALAKEKTDD